MTTPENDKQSTLSQIGNSNVQVAEVSGGTVNIYLASDNQHENVAVPEREFRNLWEKYSEENAQEIFEKVCIHHLAIKSRIDASAFQSSRYDDGVEIIAGDSGSPVDVCQCNHLINGIDDNQKMKIHNLLEAAVNSTSYKAKRWILCLPSVLTLNELAWWSEWKNKQQEQYKPLTIELWDAALLLSELVGQAAFTDLFDEDVRNDLVDVLKYLNYKRQCVQEELIYFVKDASTLGYQDAIFIKKLENAQIRELDGCKRDFFNAELAEQILKSKGEQQSIAEFNRLRINIYSLWETQFRRYQDETDGNELFTNVYERIQDLAESTLKSNLSELSLPAKQGILHQWAEECSIGWLKDYKEKLELYLQEETSDD